MQNLASSIDSRAGSPIHGTCILRRSRSRTLVNDSVDLLPQQRPHETEAQRQVVEVPIPVANQVNDQAIENRPVVADTEPPAQAEVPTLKVNIEGGHESEDDFDPDWSSDSIVSSNSSFYQSTSARKRRKRRYSPNRGPVQRTNTGSVPRVMTRRLSKIMTTGLESSREKSLRDQATPAFDSKSFSLKCPTVDESILIIFKQLKKLSAESAKYKIMDIAKPLLAFRGACESEAMTVDNICDLVDLSLDLWAVTFNHVTHSRRSNILKVTDADLLLLLNNPDHFAEDQITYLFGDKFVAALRNQASHMSTMMHVKKVIKLWKRRGLLSAATQIFS